MLSLLPFTLAIVAVAAGARDGSNFSAYSGGRGNTVPQASPAAVESLPTNFSLARLFGDHMVIQHDAPAPVWGFDVPNSRVTVTIRGGSSFENVTDATGLWRVTLSAHGMGGPHELDVSSTSGGSASIIDVYFGSVYICGGQVRLRRAPPPCQKSTRAPVTRALTTHTNKKTRTRPTTNSPTCSSPSPGRLTQRP